MQRVCTTITLLLVLRELFHTAVDYVNNENTYVALCSSFNTGVIDPNEQSDIVHRCHNIRHAVFHLSFGPARYKKNCVANM